MPRSISPFQLSSSRLSALRSGAALGLIGLLAACAGTPNSSGPQLPVSQEAATYRAHAKSYYAPPGPPDDPWGPYIREASERFDVPDPWIRAVMMRESRGQLYDSSGNFTTSVPGAMGLLQLMPPTYDDMRVQYSLGDDPYDPHDNILAGTAYLRQMYDIYGSPGFLAAYNDGPGSLDNYLRRGRPLPRETRRYVAAIGPQIAGIWPHNRSNADLLVSQHDPNARVQLAQNTPQMSDETTQESNSIRAAWRQKNTHENADDASVPMQVAEAPEAAATAIPATASASPTSVSAAWAARGIRTTAPQTVAYHPDQVSDDDNSDGSDDRVTAHEIPIGHRLPAQPIMAVMPTAKPQYRLAPPMRATAPTHTTHQEPAPDTSGPHTWAIQVGAFANAGQAGAAASRAHSNGGVTLSSAHTQVASVKAGKAHLFRARLTGLSHENAVAACHRLSHASPCVVVPPGSTF